jgi:LytS/YehU family sensor histidine kinase
LFTSGILLAAILRVPLANYLNAHYFLVNNPQPSTSAIFIASFTNIFIWTSIITSAKLVIDHFRFQENLSVIQQEKSKTELELLNAQMNPHFLFNSINTIYGQIDKSNSTARSMILTFSDLLRYQLSHGNHEKIPIEKELDYVKNYVSLQRARMDESISVNLFIDENLCGLSIAPLLFICFIENAFKYVGNAHLHKNIIEISFSRKGEFLSFKCFNTKDQLSLKRIEKTRIGIDNTKRRLTLHYPNKHDLRIINLERFYEVELTIELNEMEVHYN